MDKYALYKFFAGKASFTEEKEILDWVEDCPENREEFIRERNFYNMLLLHGNEKTHTTVRRRLPVWTKELIKIAVVFALFLGLYWHYTAKEKEIFSEVNTLRVPYGQRVDLTLPDGTEICVNAGSELQYPAVFSKDKRWVKLRGNAYFNVSHDPDRPFTVETELCDIEVLGTSFDIEAYPNSGEFLATLISGKIKLADKIHVDREIVLNPGQEAYYTPEGQFQINSLKDADRLRWREGLICFQDITLEGLIERFEKYYDVQFDVRKKEILHHEISGKLKMGDGIDHALRVLQKSVPFKYSKSDDVRTVITIE